MKFLLVLILLGLVQTQEEEVTELITDDVETLDFEDKTDDSNNTNQDVNFESAVSDNETDIQLNTDNDQIGIEDSNSVVFETNNQQQPDSSSDDDYSSAIKQDENSENEINIDSEAAINTQMPIQGDQIELEDNDQVKDNVPLSFQNVQIDDSEVEFDVESKNDSESVHLEQKSMDEKENQMREINTKSVKFDYDENQREKADQQVVKQSEAKEDTKKSEQSEVVKKTDEESKKSVTFDTKEEPKKSDDQKEVGKQAQGKTGSSEEGRKSESKQADNQSGNTEESKQSVAFEKQDEETKKPENQETGKQTDPQSVSTEEGKKSVKFEKKEEPQKSEGDATEKPKETTENQKDDQQEVSFEKKPQPPKTQQQKEEIVQQQNADPEVKGNLQESIETSRAKIEEIKANPPRGLSEEDEKKLPELYKSLENEKSNVVKSKKDVVDLLKQFFASSIQQYTEKLEKSQDEDQQKQISTKIDQLKEKLAKVNDNNFDVTNDIETDENELKEQVIPKKVEPSAGSVKFEGEDKKQKVVDQSEGTKSVTFDDGTTKSVQFEDDGETDQKDEKQKATKGSGRDGETQSVTFENDDGEKKNTEKGAAQSVTFDDSDENDDTKSVRFENLVVSKAEIAAARGQYVAAIQKITELEKEIERLQALNAAGCERKKNLKAESEYELAVEKLENQKTRGTSLKATLKEELIQFYDRLAKLELGDAALIKEKREKLNEADFDENDLEWAIQDDTPVVKPVTQSVDIVTEGEAAQSVTFGSDENDDEGAKSVAFDNDQHVKSVNLESSDDQVKSVNIGNDENGKSVTFSSEQENTQSVDIIAADKAQSVTFATSLIEENSDKEDQTEGAQSVKFDNDIDVGSVKFDYDEDESNQPMIKDLQLKLQQSKAVVIELESKVAILRKHVEDGIQGQCQALIDERQKLKDSLKEYFQTVAQKAEERVNKLKDSQADPEMINKTQAVLESVKAKLDQIAKYTDPSAQIEEDESLKTLDQIIDEEPENPQKAGSVKFEDQPTDPRAVGSVKFEDKPTDPKAAGSVQFEDQPDDGQKAGSVQFQDKPLDDSDDEDDTDDEDDEQKQKANRAQHLTKQNKFLKAVQQLQANIKDTGVKLQESVAKNDQNAQVKLSSDIKTQKSKLLQTLKQFYNYEIQYHQRRIRKLQNYIERLSQTGAQGDQKTLNQIKALQNEVAYHKNILDQVNSLRQQLDDQNYVTFDVDAVFDCEKDPEPQLTSQNDDAGSVKFDDQPQDPKASGSVNFEDQIDDSDDEDENDDDEDDEEKKNSNRKKHIVKKNQFLDAIKNLRSLIQASLNRIKDANTKESDQASENTQLNTLRARLLQLLKRYYDYEIRFHSRRIRKLQKFLAKLNKQATSSGESVPADLQNKIASITAELEQHRSNLDDVSGLRKRLDNSRYTTYDTDEVFDCEVTDQSESDHRIKKNNYLKQLGELKSKIFDAKAKSNSNNEGQQENDDQNNSLANLRQDLRKLLAEFVDYENTYHSRRLTKSQARAAQLNEEKADVTGESVPEDLVRKIDTVRTEIEYHTRKLEILKEVTDLLNDQTYDSFQEDEDFDCEGNEYSESEHRLKKKSLQDSINILKNSIQNSKKKVKAFSASSNSDSATSEQETLKSLQNQLRDALVTFYDYELKYHFKQFKKNKRTVASLKVQKDKAGEQGSSEFARQIDLAERETAKHQSKVEEVKQFILQFKDPNYNSFEKDPYFDCEGEEDDNDLDDIDDDDDDQDDDDNAAQDAGQPSAHQDKRKKFRDRSQWLKKKIEESKQKVQDADAKKDDKAKSDEEANLKTLTDRLRDLLQQYYDYEIQYHTRQVAKNRDTLNKMKEEEIKAGEKIPEDLKRKIVNVKRNMEYHNEKVNYINTLRAKLDDLNDTSFDKEEDFDCTGFDFTEQEHRLNKIIFKERVEQLKNKLILSRRQVVKAQRKKDSATLESEQKFIASSRVQLRELLNQVYDYEITFHKKVVADLQKELDGLQKQRQDAGESVPADLSQQISNYNQAIENHSYTIDTLGNIKKQLADDSYDIEGEDLFDCDAAQDSEGKHRDRRKEFQKVIRTLKDKLEDIQDEINESIKNNDNAARERSQDSYDDISDELRDVLKKYYKEETKYHTQEINKNQGQVKALPKDDPEWTKVNTQIENNTRILQDLADIRKKLDNINFRDFQTDDVYDCFADQLTYQVHRTRKSKIADFVKKYRQYIKESTDRIKELDGQQDFKGKASENENLSCLRGDLKDSLVKFYKYEVRYHEKELNDAQNYLDDLNKQKEKAGEASSTDFKNQIQAATKEVQRNKDILDDLKPLIEKFNDDKFTTFDVDQIYDCEADNDLLQHRAAKKELANKINDLLSQVENTNAAIADASNEQKGKLQEQVDNLKKDLKDSLKKYYDDEITFHTKRRNEVQEDVDQLNQDKNKAGKEASAELLKNLKNKAQEIQNHNAIIDTLNEIRKNLDNPSDESYLVDDLFNCDVPNDDLDLDQDDSSSDSGKETEDDDQEDESDTEQGRANRLRKHATQQSRFLSRVKQIRSQLAEAKKGEISGLKRRLRELLKVYYNYEIRYHSRRVAKTQAQLDQVKASPTRDQQTTALYDFLTEELEAQNKITKSVKEFRAKLDDPAYQAFDTEAFFDCENIKEPDQDERNVIKNLRETIRDSKSKLSDLQEQLKKAEVLASKAKESNEESSSEDSVKEVQKLKTVIQDEDDKLAAARRKLRQTLKIRVDRIINYYVQEIAKLKQSQADLETEIKATAESQEDQIEKLEKQLELVKDQIEEFNNKLKRLRAKRALLDEDSFEVDEEDDNDDEDFDEDQDDDDEDEDDDDEDDSPQGQRTRKARQIRNRRRRVLKERIIKKQKIVDDLKKSLGEQEAKGASQVDLNNLKRQINEATEDILTHEQDLKQLDQDDAEDEQFFKDRKVRLEQQKTITTDLASLLADTQDLEVTLADLQEQLNDEGKKDEHEQISNQINDVTQQIADNKQRIENLKILLKKIQDDAQLDNIKVKLRNARRTKKAIYDDQIEENEAKIEELLQEQENTQKLASEIAVSTETGADLKRSTFERRIIRILQQIQDLITRNHVLRLEKQILDLYDEQEKRRAFRNIKKREVDARIRGLEAEIETLEKDLMDLDEQIERAENNEKLKSSIEARVKDINVKIISQQNLLSLYQLNRQRLDFQDEQIEQRRKLRAPQIRRLEASIAKLQEEWRQQDSKWQDLENQLSKIPLQDPEREQAVSNTAQVIDEVTALREQIAPQREERRILIFQEDRFQFKGHRKLLILDLQNKIRTTENQSEDYKKLIVDLQAKLTSLETGTEQHDKIQTQVSELKKRVEDNQKAIDVMWVELQKLLDEEQEEDSEQKRSERESKIEEIKQKIVEQQQEVAKIQESSGDSGQSSQSSSSSSSNESGQSSQSSISSSGESGESSQTSSGSASSSEEESSQKQSSATDSNLDKRIQELKEKIEAHQQEQRKLEEESQASDQRIQKSEEMQQIEQEIKEELTNVDQLEQKLQELYKQVEQADKTLKEKVDELHVSITQVEQELEVHQQKVAELRQKQQQLAVATETAEEKESSSNATEETTVDRETRQQQLEKLISEGDLSLQKLRKLKSDLQEKLQNGGDQEELGKQIESVSEKIKQLEEKLSIFKKERKGIDADEKAEKELAERNQQKSDLDSQIKEVEGQISVLERNLSKLDSQLLQTDDEQEKRSILQDIKETQKEINELRVELQNLQRERRGLEEDGDAQSSQATQSDSKELEKKELDLKISTLEQQIEADNIELEDLQRRFSSSSTNQDQKERLSKLIEDLRQAISEKRKKLEKQRRLRKRLDYEDARDDDDQDSDDMSGQCRKRIWSKNQKINDILSFEPRTLKDPECATEDQFNYWEFYYRVWLAFFKDPDFVLGDLNILIAVRKLMQFTREKIIDVESANFAEMMTEMKKKTGHTNYVQILWGKKIELVMKYAKVAEDNATADKLVLVEKIIYMIDLIIKDIQTALAEKDIFNLYRDYLQIKLHNLLQYQSSCGYIEQKDVDVFFQTTFTLPTAQDTPPEKTITDTLSLEPNLNENQIISQIQMSLIQVSVNQSNNGDKDQNSHDQDILALAEIGFSVENEIPDRQITVFLQNIVLENNVSKEEEGNDQQIKLTAQDADQSQIRTQKQNLRGQMSS